MNLHSLIEDKRISFASYSFSDSSNSLLANFVADQWERVLHNAGDFDPNNRTQLLKKDEFGVLFLDRKPIGFFCFEYGGHKTDFLPDFFEHQLRQSGARQVSLGNIWVHEELRGISFQPKISSLICALGVEKFVQDNSAEWVVAITRNNRQMNATFYKQGFSYLGLGNKHGEISDIVGLSSRDAQLTCSLPARNLARLIVNAAVEPRLKQESDSTSPFLETQFC